MHAKNSLESTNREYNPSSASNKHQNKHNQGQNYTIIEIVQNVAST